MLPKTIIHLLSGGLDSVTMLYDLVRQGHRVHCLLFDYKQAHARELLWARHHAHALGLMHTVMDLPHLGGLRAENWVVPNRNAIFLSLAVNVAVHAGADTITIGCNADDEEYFPDCRREFLEEMNFAVVAAGYREIEICAPYLDWPKSRIVEMAGKLGVKVGEVWTCYRGGEVPCGECPACVKLAAALP